MLIILIVGIIFLRSRTK